MIANKDYFSKILEKFDGGGRFLHSAVITLYIHSKRVY